MDKIKIVFFGTPDFVDPIIKVLDDKFDLVAVVRKPMEFSKEEIQDLKNLDADYFVVAAYGKIIPENVLSIPKQICINIHPSILPKYRGPSPIQTVILNGDNKTGVTFIKMDSEIDHGPIIYQFEEEINDEDTFLSLAKRLFEKSATTLEHVITGFEKAKYAEIQNEKEATFTKLFKKEDGFIDPSAPPKDLEQKIRAFYPWPSAWTKYTLTNKEVIIKLIPDGKIQVESKKPMTYKDFMNGYEDGRNLLEKLSLI